MQFASARHETNLYFNNEHRLVIHGCKQGRNHFVKVTSDCPASFPLVNLTLSQGIVLNLESEQTVKENIMLQITNASQMIKLEKDPFAAFALIIDGKSLTYGLEDDMKQHFLDLAVDCASVICCRVSPRQKALVLFFYIS